MLFFTVFLPCYAYTGNIVIYVNDFRTSDKNNKADIGAALAGTVADTISSSSGIEVITIETRRKALQELAFSQMSSDDGTSAAKLLAADYTVNGSYTISGDVISISAEIIDVSDHVIVDSFHSEGRTGRIQEIASKVGFNLSVLMKKHGLTNNEIIDNPVKRIQPSIKAYTYYSLGLKAYYDNPAVAYEYFRKASSSDPEYIDAIIDAAVTALDLSQYDSAVDLTGNGEKIMNMYNLKYSIQYARLMHVKGMVYFKLQNYPAATESYMTSLSVLKYLKTDGTSYAAEAINGLALVLRKKFLFDEASEKFNSALKILDNLGMKNSLQYAEILNNIAALETAAGNYENALKYNGDSLEIKNKIGLKISKTCAVTLSNRGVIMAASKKNNEALELTDRALKIFQILNLEDTDEYALAEANAGFFFSGMNNHKDAIKRFENAQRIRKRTGSFNTSDYYKTAIKLAGSYHASGDNCKALKTARDAVKLVKAETFKNDNDMMFISELEKLCKH